MHRGYSDPDVFNKGVWKQARNLSFVDVVDRIVIALVILLFGTLLFGLPLLFLVLFIVGAAGLGETLLFAGVNAFSFFCFFAAFGAEDLL